MSLDQVAFQQPVVSVPVDANQQGVQYPPLINEIQLKLHADDQAEFTKLVDLLLVKDTHPMVRMTAYSALKQLIPKEFVSRLYLNSTFDEEQKQWSVLVICDGQTVITHNELSADSEANLKEFHEFVRLNSRQWFVDNGLAQQHYTENVFDQVTQPQFDSKHSYVKAAKQLIALLPKELQSQFQIVKHGNKEDWFFTIEFQWASVATYTSPSVMACSVALNANSLDDFQILERQEQIHLFIKTCIPRNKVQAQELLNKLGQEYSLQEHLQIFHELQALCSSQPNIVLTAEMVEFNGNPNIQFLTLNVNDAPIFCSCPIATFSDNSTIVGKTEVNMAYITSLVDAINQYTYQNQIDKEIEKKLAALTDCEIDESSVENFKTLITELHELLAKSLSKQKYQAEFTKLETECKQKLTSFDLWKQVSKYCDKAHRDNAYKAFQAITTLHTQISEQTNQQQFLEFLLPHLRELRTQLKQDGRALLTIKSTDNPAVKLVVSFGDQPLYATEAYPANSPQANAIKNVASNLELEFTAEITIEKFKEKVDGWRRSGTEGYKKAYGVLLDAIEKKHVDGMPMYPQTKAEAFFFLRNFLTAEGAALFNGALEPKYFGSPLYLHLRLGNADIIKPLKVEGETSIALIKDTLGQTSEGASKMLAAKFSEAGLRAAHNRAARIQRGISYTPMTASELQMYLNSSTASPTQSTLISTGAASALPSPSRKPQTAIEFAQEMADEIKKRKKVSGMLKYLDSQEFKDSKHLLPSNCLMHPEFIRIWGPIFIMEDKDSKSYGKTITAKEALEKHGRQYL